MKCLIKSGLIRIVDNNGGMATRNGKGISKKTENAILFLAGAEKDARVPDNWMTTATRHPVTYPLSVVAKMTTTCKVFLQVE